MAANYLQAIFMPDCKKQQGQFQGLHRVTVNDDALERQPSLAAARADRVPVGLLPPFCRLVDEVDLQDQVGVALPVEAHPFADQKMRPHELHTVQS
jgi:hypothetical protein